MAPSRPDPKEVGIQDSLLLKMAKEGHLCPRRSVKSRTRAFVGVGGIRRPGTLTQVHMRPQDLFLSGWRGLSGILAPGYSG